MHIKQHGSNRYIALLIGIIAIAAVGVANADPPARVARLGYVNGPVSFSPAGDDDWVQAGLNRPLVTGDRLWADAGARTELQMGSAAIRLSAMTSVTLLNLDDRIVQLQLAQGTLNVRVRRLDADQIVEIDTPNLAYVVRRPGQYRISVDVNGNATDVFTSNGQAAVYGEGASYVVDAGRAYRFVGTGLRDYEALALPGVDEFDRWAQERDRSSDNSVAARYVSRDVIGSEDLDAYGTWQAVPEYGNVWMPTRVSSGWAPYRDGHWAWVDPWGWTWVDEAPWGFAVSHYGRWASIGGNWGWVPGPVAARAVYAPALVVFLGGNDFGASIASGGAGAVGWFPLGPRDVYRPAYPVSRTYFTNVNISNTVINTTNVTNVYNASNVTNVTYVNQQVRGAVVAVPTTAFIQSQPVARAMLSVPHDAVVRAQVTAVAAVAPMQVSVRGAAPEGRRPPAQASERPVVAKSVPPPAPVGFAAKERALAGNPGKPIDPSALAAMRPVTPVSAPKIEVIAPTGSASPAAAPPPQSAKANPRGKDEQRTPPQAMTRGTQLQAGTQTSPPAQPTQRELASPQRGVPQASAETGGNAEGRNRPNAPAPVAAPVNVARPPPANAPAPGQALPEQRTNTLARTPPNAPGAAPPAVAPTTQANAPAPVLAPYPVARAPQANAPASAQAPSEPRNKAEAPARPNVSAPNARALPEQQGARAEPAATAKPVPMPSAPPAPAAVARAPVPGPAAGPPPNSEGRGKDTQPASDKKGDKKGDEPGKSDEELKRK